MGYFDSFADFLAMGTHGLYVWTAYAVGAGVFVFNLVSPRLMRKKLVAEHKRRLRREQV